jgi:hypothetical protein
MIRVKSRLWVNDHLYLIIFSAPVVVISISSLMTGFLSPGTSHLEPVVHPIHPTTQASSFRLSLLCAMSLIQLFLADSLSSDYYHHHHRRRHYDLLHTVYIHNRLSVFILVFSLYVLWGANVMASVSMALSRGFP